MTGKEMDARFRQIISSDAGYFGHVLSWGMTKERYVNIGYVPTSDLIPLFDIMSPEQRIRIGRVMGYFEMHMRPLKNMLNAEEDQLGRTFTQWAWSHFAILIMFGIVELGIRHEQGIPDGKRLYGQGKKIASFFLKHIRVDQQADVLKKYRQEASREGKVKFSSFQEVVENMWSEYRSEFVHSGGIESVPLEGAILTNIKGEPGTLTFIHDVPVHKWLALGWQTVLSAFGYKGALEEGRFKIV